MSEILGTPVLFFGIFTQKLGSPRKFLFRMKPFFFFWYFPSSFGRSGSQQSVLRGSKKVLAANFFCSASSERGGTVKHNSKNLKAKKRAINTSFTVNYQNTPGRSTSGPVCFTSLWNCPRFPLIRKLEHSRHPNLRL